MREGHLSEQSAEGLRRLHPLRQRLGPVEVEDAARTRMGIALIAEESLHAGGLVAEGQRLGTEASREEVGQIRRIMGRLLRHSGERDAFLLRLDDTDWLAVCEEQIVAATGLQRHLA